MQATPAFVSMFDMLGFKRRRAKLGTSGLHQLYERGILPSIQHSAALAGRTEIIDGEPKFVPNPGPFSVGYRAISDTVIFWTRDVYLVSFMSIVDASYQLMQFGMGSRTPWRGAVGYGDLIVGPEIMIGSAVEDAYEGEKEQVWAGAMLTSACRNFVLEQDYVEQRRHALLDRAGRDDAEGIRRTLRQNAELLIEYDVPLQRNLKDGPVSYFTQRTLVIDWTVRGFENAARSALPVSENAHARRIRENTVTFETWARARPERVA